MSETDESIIPDTKDWTFVIDGGCRECGFIPGDARNTGDVIRSTVERWQAALARDDAARRAQRDTWSTLEYGCHVRDVCGVFSTRLGLMLDQDAPDFPDWNQDAAAVEGHYDQQDPAVVAEQYAEAANALAEQFDAVRPDQWRRTGMRSNGSAFTVETLSTYLAHDVLHHLFDVNA